MAITDNIGAIHIDRTPLEPNEGSAYRPLCSCGWEGGLWQSYEDAQFQIGDHVRHPEGVIVSDPATARP
jgi:hypothetical protein